MEKHTQTLPASLDEVMEMLWPRIGDLWSAALLCLSELMSGANRIKRADVLALLEPAEAMFRRALVLLAEAEGIGNFFSLPSFNLGGCGFSLADLAEDKAPLFRLTEPDLGTLDDGQGTEPSPLAPTSPALAQTAVTTEAPEVARNLLALETRLRALDAALEDPLTHVKRMGRLLWRAAEEETPPPVNLVCGAMVPPEAGREAVALLEALNTRACHALWHPPP